MAFYHVKKKQTNIEKILTLDIQKLIIRRWGSLFQVEFVKRNRSEMRLELEIGTPQEANLLSNIVGAFDI